MKKPLDFDDIYIRGFKTFDPCRVCEGYKDIGFLDGFIWNSDFTIVNEIII